MKTSEQNIMIELIELPPYEQMERDWLELEARSDSSFFTSWSWIGCWLACLPSHIQPKLLRAISGEKTVGMGILVSRNFLRHNFIPVSGLYLHATGNPLLDQITIENNGFLADREMQSVVVMQLLEYLVLQVNEWDELHLDGVTNTSSFKLPNFSDLHIQREQKKYFCVDLDAVRAAGGDYFTLISHSSRSKIRRSIKEITKKGPITLTSAGNSNEALAFLAGLKELHQDYWRARGFPGSFDNVYFENFHERLIRSRFDCGEIQLIQIKVGDRTLGYLYNLLWQNVVYCYQSGFDYSIAENNNNNRPGLVIHCLAIEYNVSQGHRVYDLMAGDYQYKNTLGTNSCEMDWIVLQRDRLKFRVEDGLRHIRRRLLNVVGTKTLD